jgi:hypothetical protein
MPVKLRPWDVSERHEEVDDGRGRGVVVKMAEAARRGQATATDFVET